MVELDCLKAKALLKLKMRQMNRREISRSQIRQRKGTTSEMSCPFFLVCH